MEDFMHWLLTSVLGPLMLPLFALATLCVIAGVKPEPIVTGFMSLIGSFIGGVFGVLATLIRSLSYWGYRKTYPPPSRKYPPKS